MRQGYARSPSVDRFHTVRRPIIPRSVARWPKEHASTKGITPLNAQALYHKLVYKIQGGPSSPPPWVRSFQVKGDHLYLAEVNGSSGLYVRLNKTGSFFRMVEGDSVRRDFDSVTVTLEEPPGGIDAIFSSLGNRLVDATLYASIGPFMEHHEKRTGFRRGFFAGQGTAPAAGQFLFQEWVNKYATVPSANPIDIPFGKFGGTLIIRNNDLSNTLLVGYGKPSALNADQVFQVYAGETLTMTIEDRIWNRDVFDNGNSDLNSIVVKTVSGTCSYSFLFSSLDADTNDVLFRGAPLTIGP